MARAFILVMDSFGVGAAHDADRFDESGADTLGHIAEACACGQGDLPGARRGPLALPNLSRLGLARLAKASTGRVPAGLDGDTEVCGAYGFADELSRGKDTPSGHWEMAGLPVEFDWGYFPKTEPCFPADLTEALIARTDLPGILGNRHASGTAIIEELGAEHLRSGKPICYTSADSVFQIAAHEEAFGLDRLYRVCEIAKALTEPLRIARVIARPFTGAAPGAFKRTARRRDYTTPPHGPTLLDRLEAAGKQVIGVGKIADIFAGRGVTEILKADDNMGLFDRTLEAAGQVDGDRLIFTNFVDFDTLFGHRRDVAGYAAALEDFDRRLPELERLLRPGDLAAITADHGCDPTWPGSDHTRERVPVMMFGPKVAPCDLGRRKSFADIGQTLAEHFGLTPLEHGESFYRQVVKLGVT